MSHIRYVCCSFVSIDSIRAGIVHIERISTNTRNGEKSESTRIIVLSVLIGIVFVVWSTICAANRNEHITFKLLIDRLKIDQLNSTHLELDPLRQSENSN